MSYLTDLTWHKTWIRNHVRAKCIQCSSSCLAYITYMNNHKWMLIWVDWDVKHINYQFTEIKIHLERGKWQWLLCMNARLTGNPRQSTPESENDAKCIRLQKRKWNFYLDVHGTPDWGRECSGMQIQRNTEGKKSRLINFKHHQTW